MCSGSAKKVFLNCEGTKVVWTGDFSFFIIYFIFKLIRVRIMTGDFSSKRIVGYMDYNYNYNSVKWKI